jgi:hypothetical protein
MAASKTTEARWRSVVREQEASGRTVREFARLRGLSAATLYWWRSELGRREVGRDDRIALARVTVLGSTAPARSRAVAGIEVELANGRRLCVARDFDVEALRELVAALER